MSLARTIVSRHSSSTIVTNLAIVFFNVVLIGIMWIAVLEVARIEREETVNAAIDNNNNLAIALEQYTTRTIEGADSVLRYMIREYLRASGKIDLDKFASDFTINSTLYTGIALADENGDITSTAFIGKPARPVNVADREHFKVHVARDTEAVFVGKPVTGRLTGTEVVPLTRRINKPDGSFGGVMVILIDYKHFTNMLLEAKMRPFDVFSVVGLDGITRSRLRGSIFGTGEDISKSPIFIEQAKHPNGSFQNKGQLDGMLKFFSYRTLPQYRLMTIVGTAEADVLAEFTNRQRRYFWAAGVSSAFIAGFSVLLILSLRRQRKAVEEVNRSQARYLATFNQIAVGIGHADLEGRCLDANQKLCDITGYTREELVGRNFNEITHPDDVAASNAFRRGLMAQSKAANLPQREKRYIRKDGSIVWCQLTNSIVRDSAGNIAHLAAIIRDITEKKKADEDRAQLAAIVESSNDAIISRSMDGTIASWNKSAERMFGWTATEIIGKPIQTLSPPDRRGNFMHVLEQVKRGEISEPYDTERVHKDGTRFDARISLSAVKDAAGNVTGIAIIIRDISDRKRAEQAQTQLAAIVESSNDAIISSMPEAKTIISWNRAAECMFGWSAGEAIGQTVRIITPPEYLGRLDPLIRRMMQGETVAPVETWRQRKDGSRFEAQISFSAIRDSEGKITAIATIIRDITERREKEAIAHKEKLFSDSMIESMPGIVYFYNEQGRFLRWNENFARVSGYTSEEIAKMHPLDFFGGNEKHLLERKIREVFEKSESSVEASFLLKNGSAVPYFFTGKRVLFDGAVCLVGMGVDIHERKQAEAALRDYAAQMRHLSWRLSEVEERERRDIHRELHDRVGANLAALKLDLGLINNMLSPEDRKTVGDRLQKAQQLTGETITQIRDVMGNLRPPALDDFGLLAALRTCAQPQAARMGIPVTVDGDDIEPRLGIAVETALFRIVQEALSNVAKHAQARHVAITITTTADRVILVVADDGRGFDSARPGPQIDNWGLRTMRERAQAIAADLHIESSPGKGTRIVVELPREGA